MIRKVAVTKSFGTTPQSAICGPVSWPLGACGSLSVRVRVRIEATSHGSDDKELLAYMWKPSTK